MLNPLKIHVTVRMLQRMSRHFGTPFAFTLRRALRLHNRSLFSLDDIVFWGLTDPAIAESEIDNFMSREARVRLENRVNDKSAGDIVDDKAVFYSRCEELKLPVPRSIGVFTDPATAPSGQGPQQHRAEWVDRLTALSAETFFCKPAHGMKGEGVNRVTRRGERFIIDDQTMDAGQLYSYLAERARHDQLILQHTLAGHDDLCGLCGTSAVQSVRLVTFVTPDGECKILFSRFKLVVDGNQTDNFASGHSGNLIADVDLQSGQINKAFSKQPGTVGLTPIVAHPNSETRLSGFVIPYWQSALDLAEKAAHAFLPLRLLAWDIAITPEGPVLLEANQEWEIFPIAPITLPVPRDEWIRLSH